MQLERIQLPPVSKRFYDQIRTTFPPIDARDIKPGTTMIEVQRRAAQQEVISFIENAVRETETEYKPTTLYERLKYVILGRL